MTKGLVALRTSVAVIFLAATALPVVGETADLMRYQYRIQQQKHLLLRQQQSPLEARIEQFTRDQLWTDPIDLSLYDPWITMHPLDANQPAWWKHTYRWQPDVFPGIENLDFFEFDIYTYPKMDLGGRQGVPWELLLLALGQSCEALGYSVETCNDFRQLWDINPPNTTGGGGKLETGYSGVQTVYSTTVVRMDEDDRRMLADVSQRIARIEKMAEEMYREVMGEEYTDEESEEPVSE